MALRIILIAAAIVAIITAPAFATDFIVGDWQGWKLNVDYQAWAAGKQFYVGDKLILMYHAGAHNVHEVNGTEFQTCSASSLNTPLTSGDDEIILSSPGKKWYLCGIGSHCESGMKLAITVLPQAASSPAPAPSPPTNNSPSSKFVSSTFLATLLIAAFAPFFIVFA